MKTDKYKQLNKSNNDRNQSKNQLIETIFQRQKFKIQELLNKKYNPENLVNQTNETK